MRLKQAVNEFAIVPDDKAHIIVVETNRRKKRLIDIDRHQPFSENIAQNAIEA
jgi:hypothetical protein